MVSRYKEIIEKSSSKGSTPSPATPPTKTASLNVVRRQAGECHFFMYTVVNCDSQLKRRCCTRRPKSTGRKHCAARECQPGYELLCAQPACANVERRKVIKMNAIF